MKQKDVALIIVIAFFSAIASLFVSRLVFTSPKNREQSVQVVQSISANFPAPDSRYFNAQSVDPTQLIQIGNNNNQNPFNATNGSPIPARARPSMPCRSAPTATSRTG